MKILSLLSIEDRTRATRSLGVVCLLLLAACGGGGGNATAPNPTASTFTVGGTVTGLNGSGLVLQNNGGDNLAISANGAFSFPAAIADGGAYSVGVLAEPGNPAQTCATLHGSGTVTGASVTDVDVVCIDTTVTNTTVSPVAVSLVFPNEARAGETIAVYGQRFGATQGTSTLSINGAVATQIASWSDTEIVATVPVGATTGNVTVTVDGVAGAPGHLIVLWQATNPANVAVSAAAGDQNAPQLIADGAGGAIMVWEDVRNGSGNVYAQRFNNAGRPLWAAGGVAVGVPFALSSTLPGIIAPQLIADGTGGAIVVWSDFRDGIFKVYAQRLNGAGEAQWAVRGVRVSTSTMTEIKPQLTSDGAGGAVVAWYVIPGVGQSGTYAQRLDATGAAQWAAEGVFIGPQYDFDSSGDIGQRRLNRGPALIPDGTGGAFIASSGGSVSTTPTLSADSAVQRVNGAGAVQWAAGGVVLTAPTAGGATAGITLHPQLVPDGAQGVIIVTQADVGNGIAILAQRLDGAGRNCGERMACGSASIARWRTMRRERHR